MTTSPEPHLHLVGTDEAALSELRSSWMRSLRAAGKAPRTMESYGYAVDQFSAWCRDHGRPVNPTKQRRRDVEDYIGWLIDERSRGTAGVRYRSLRQWFRWLAEEEEIEADITAGMKHPKLDEPVVPVIGEDDLRKLLDVCKGRGFYERRDLAIVRVLIDTGLRLSELVGITLDDIDLDASVIVVNKTKTRRGKVVPLGAKAVEAVDRYLRVRAQHRYAESPRLWLGMHGPFTAEGVRQMFNKRTAEAGIAHIHPHQFRHTFAHRWKMLGGDSDGLSSIGGWTPGSAMLSRYGASAASERARQAHRRIAPGDSL
jgi:site-specific recombinase XerD